MVLVTGGDEVAEDGSSGLDLPSRLPVRERTTANPPPSARMTAKKQRLLRYLDHSENGNHSKINPESMENF